ncbi:uncharacterized protein LOC111060167 isoform X5 [Nilaparvata lugens]|uniref:uncharacterized protein LOC111060167 isoform X5 n=1 Tax=Nilaparvata lugens TaxID=108931 RepID=UPI00193DAC78|nr:uncharacterized protein LOC111060167 isoform X5 [Nilaparvata lugens]
MIHGENPEEGRQTLKMFAEEKPVFIIITCWTKNSFCRRYEGLSKGVTVSPSRLMTNTDTDSLVGYRNHLLSEAMRKSTSFDQKLGWTGEPAFRRLEQEHQRREQQYKTRPSTNYQAIPPPPDMERRKEIHAPEELITGGVELVPLLARRRALPQHCPLSTTDVTNTRLRTPVMPPPARSPTWNKPEMEKEYLSELTNQVHYKQKKIRDAHTEDLANSRRHFETWCNFWGRPGHGAPKQSNVKENLNYLLYDAPVK